MHMYLLERDNTWAGPRNYRASQYRVRVSWASLPNDESGRAGPGRDFRKNDGPGRAVNV